MPPQVQPIDLLDAKDLVPSEMRTAEWALVDQWVRERSFYMAGVAEAEVLQEMRDLVRLAATAEAGEFELRKRWEAFLDRRGYQPAPGQEGTVKDLRSLKRFNVALRTNLALLREWARKERELSPGPLRAQPAWELVRVSPAKAPRDWEERWAAVGGETYDGRMIAPKLDLIWAELGNRGNFPDALGVDYPPFAWGSGMRCFAVGAREAIELGVMTRDEIRAQVEAGAARPVHSPNESLELAPKVRDADLREALAERLGGLARWDGEEGERLVFTDPNGTRPATEAELADIWARPLPEAFHELAPDGQLQRQAALDFSEDPEAFMRRPERDRWDDLVRAVERLADAPQRPRILPALAARGEGWLDRLVSSSAWKAASLVVDLAPRAVGIVAAIKRLFL